MRAAIATLLGVGLFAGLLVLDRPEPLAPEAHTTVEPPQLTRRLATSASPYLREHADNPVDWYPWDDEALSTARQDGRLLFLSIGYATCHWCHVMEEESFKDPEIAAFLNTHFVPVKVDRETRPDLDRLYMKAVQAMTGRGGWPATLVLTPDLQPIYAATYLPARDGDRGRQTGLLTLLRQIADKHAQAPDQTAAFGAKLAAHLIAQERVPTTGLPGDDRLQATVEAAKSRFDPVNGGTRGRPKFPSQMPLRTLLLAADHGHDSANTIATRTLDAMMSGGLYDHLGGGFHRYTVDERWDVPHFEKMLYDNALLSLRYGEAFAETGDRRYARVTRETLEMLMATFGLNGGGFGSARDADTLNASGHREEGLTYTYTPTEVEAVLGDAANAFNQAYGITPEGNLEGRSVLRDTENQWAEFRKERLTLLLARNQRNQPLLDDKLITGWNGLAIAAFARNGWLLHDQAWLEQARDAADRILESRVAGRLVRVVDDPDSKTAFLDDYAYMTMGLLELFEATGERRWLDETRALIDQAKRHHGAPQGPWYQSPDDGEPLLIRARPVDDQALPSANSILLGSLVRLHALTDHEPYRDMATGIATGLPFDRPAGHPHAVAGLYGLQHPLKTVVLVRADGERSSGMHAALKTLHPDRRVLVHQVDGEPPVLPLTSGKLRQESMTAYVCIEGVCKQPTTDPATLAAQLAE